MSATRIFVSFDAEHDASMFERLLADSGSPGSSFCVSGLSENRSASEGWSDRVRRKIRAADQMIVICGEHTETSISVSAELRIAQEEGTPYFLLWGRRGVPCTKPVGAKTTEGMYSWTRQILQNQIAATLRSVRPVARIPIAS